MLTIKKMSPNAELNFCLSILVYFYLDVLSFLAIKMV